VLHIQHIGFTSSFMPTISSLAEALHDRYLLDRELGRGGMATVYLARDLKYDRLVAVKVLRPDLVAVLGAERFLREIRLTAQLQHPHILSLLDSGEAAGLLFYVMPYVEGQSLRQRLAQEGQLSVEEALRISRGVASSLDYAHQRGTVHRDIKPENILLAEGEPMLADFGIALAAASAGGERLTETGLSLGTPAYMSPEQASASPRVDGRSDQYALACVTYEMLAGEPPYTGPSAQAIVAKRFSEPIPHLSTVRAVPSAVDRVLQKALALAPADRFTTTGRFVEALAAAVASPLNAATTKHRRGVRAAVLVAGVLAGLAALFAWLQPHSVEPENGVAKRLAVLPFENLGRPEQEYFADGVTDEITTRLGGVSGLGVISRHSAMAYKSTTKPLRQVGAELGVAFVLEGTVRWDRTESNGGRIRVTPQLIEVDGDRQLWAKSFDVDLSDVFGVQRRIAEEVAHSLGVTLLPGDGTPLAPPTTKGLAAYDAYLRGNSAFFQMASTGGIVGTAAAAIAAYEEAVRLNPSLALGWARLAQAIAPLTAGAPTSRWADGRRAREAARRAAELAPDLAEVQLAVAAVSTGEAAKRALKRAYFLAPTDPQVLQVLARRTQEAGPTEYDLLVLPGVDTLDAKWRCRASLQLLHRAEALDPRSIPILRGLYAGYECLNERDRAAAAVNRAIEIAPALAEQWQMKAGLHLDVGDLEQARVVLREAKQHVAREDLVAYMAAINDQYWVLDEVDQRFLLQLGPEAFGQDSMGWALSLAHTLALRGDSAGARAYADTTLQVIRRHPDATLGIYEMTALAYLHRRKEALAVMRRSVEDGPGEPAPGWNYTQLQAVRTYNILGERDSAVAAFLRFVHRTNELLPLRPSWRLDPVSSPLRGDPRFEALFQGRPSRD
jgi:eukaryotic-like serine/threonine-protein kinase